MKLFDFLNDHSLNYLRAIMAAPLIEKSELLNKDDICYADILEAIQEKEVNIDDLEIGADSLLYLKGILVTLNLKNTSNRVFSGHMPKLHLAYCRAVQTMKLNQQNECYNISCRTDTYRKTHKITSTVSKVNDLEVQLDICYFCLEKIKWNYFSLSMMDEEKDKIISEFKLKDFYAKYAAESYSDLSIMEMLHTNHRD